jgi:hypothetical protein
VADPEVDAPMTRLPGLGRLVPLLLLALLLLGSVSVPTVRAAATNPVTGSVTGPTILATGAQKQYVFNGTGGPAIASNGTQVGNLTFSITLSASNLTGVSLAPTSGKVVNGIPLDSEFTAGPTAQVVTFLVELSSTYQSQNQSTNFTYSVNVVSPYVVRAEIVNPSSDSVDSFGIQVFLDGSLVGTVTVPTMTPGSTYNLSYQYVTPGLSPGYHTFTISLAQEHGLVTFANGALQYSSTVYVTGPAPDYTLWYVVGIVAFFGVLFILLTRVAARRRGALRR